MCLKYWAWFFLSCSETCGWPRHCRGSWPPCKKTERWAAFQPHHMLKMVSGTSEGFDAPTSTHPQLCFSLWSRVGTLKVSHLLQSLLPFKLKFIATWILSTQLIFCIYFSRNFPQMCISFHSFIKLFWVGTFFQSDSPVETASLLSYI